MLSVPVSAMNTQQPSAMSASAATPLQAATSRSRTRVVLVVSADANVRERLRHALTTLRWQVLESPGGAEAWMAAQSTPIEALLIDPWLPDLDVMEFLDDFHRDHPAVDLIMTDGVSADGSPRSPYHQELLYALRRSQDTDSAAWQTAPMLEDMPVDVTQLPSIAKPGPSQMLNRSGIARDTKMGFKSDFHVESDSRPHAVRNEADTTSANISVTHRKDASAVECIPTLVGTSASMLEVSRRIRLVAGRSTPVLIEGPTGSGKELVAEALHRLSMRSRKPFVAINCAAIPEALLEAELFGHTRGAFTGAVQGRTGRIESADGGTLFLDEIGEMPLGLQSKLLRFFESGELQRIGDNETVKVDVRIVAATHQPLAEDAQKGTFRADLYYRLAVFLIRTPALAEHMEDLPQLVAHFVERMGRKSPVKRIDASAMAKLAGHHWPGNVRELEHVLERASILAGDDPLITGAEIDFGLSMMN